MRKIVATTAAANPSPRLAILSLVESKLTQRTVALAVPGRDRGRTDIHDDRAGVMLSELDRRNAIVAAVTSSIKRRHEPPR
jgi:hypothetical protein